MFQIPHLDSLINNTPAPITKDVFRQRREKLQEYLSHHQGIAILFNTSEKVRNNDVYYPHRFDSFFYYLTGVIEAEAITIITPQTSILLTLAKNPLLEQWEGTRLGIAGALDLGFDEAFELEKFQEILESVVIEKNQGVAVETIACLFPIPNVLQDLLNSIQKKQRRVGGKAPFQYLNLHHFLSDCRLHKDNHEIAMMHHAAKISHLAHQTAQDFCQNTYQQGNTLSEHHIAAVFDSIFTYHQGTWAYPHIVAGGKNACILHYRENNKPLKNGDLLLIDAGCEYQGYASDLTRTFAINGTMNFAQKSLWDLVKLAQEKAIAHCKMGHTFLSVHDIAIHVLTQGLMDLNLIQEKCSLESAIEQKLYQPFFMHKIGHWLGLDVHDVGNYQEVETGNSRILQSNMVMTVEPGLYIPNLEHIPAEFHHIGIRIEDDILITTTEPVILGL